MKKLWIVAALFAVAMINGCGGGSSGYVSAPGSREIIVFQRQQAIYAMAPDGSNERFVTNGVSPILIPNQSKVAFFLPAAGGTMFEAFTCNLNGTERKALGFAVGGSPAWSPDGSKIVYSGLGAENSQDNGLFLINADGSGKKRLTTNRFDSYPSFTPDGQRISFYRPYYSPTATEDGILSVDLNGENESFLAKGGYLGHDWSPDGKSLVYIDGAGGKYGATYNLFLKRMDGSVPVKLTNEGSFKFKPSFSPDGRKVVFADDKGSSSAVPPGQSVSVDNLYILDLNTNEVRKLTSNNESQFPDWGRF